MTYVDDRHPDHPRKPKRAASYGRAQSATSPFVEQRKPVKSVGRRQSRCYDPVNRAEGHPLMALRSSTVIEWTEEYEGIARWAVADHFIPGGDRADLLQEARLGIWQGISAWRPGAGRRRDTFLAMCARRRVYDAIKRATARKHEALNDAASFENPVAELERETVRVEDLLFRWWDDPLDIVIAREEASLLLRLMRLLSPWERECVERVRLGGESYDFAGPSRFKSVDNALQRATRKLAHPTADDLERAAA